VGDVVRHQGGVTSKATFFTAFLPFPSQNCLCSSPGTRASGRLAPTPSHLHVGERCQLGSSRTLRSPVFLQRGRCSYGTSAASFGWCPWKDPQATEVAGAGPQQALEPAGQPKDDCPHPPFRRAAVAHERGDAVTLRANAQEEQLASARPLLWLDVVPIYA
jgi:hypothetical protein